METKLSYYDYAEDDYNYLKDCIDAGHTELRWHQ